MHFFSGGTIIFSDEEKYIDDAAAQLIIPAKIKPATLQQVQQTALAAC
jgi:D-alanine-D-alanine ligase-like ATP-grasp enzyme